MSKNTAKNYFTRGCLWLEFLSWGWRWVYSMHACWCSCDFNMVTSWLIVCHNLLQAGFKMVMSCLIVCHKLPQICIALSMVPLQMFQTLMHTAYLVCQLEHMGPTRKTPCDIKDTVAVQAQWWCLYPFYMECIFQCLSSFTAFFCHSPFSVLVTTGTCNVLGMSFLCCLPTWNWWTQSTTVFSTHTAPQTAHICL